MSIAVIKQTLDTAIEVLGQEGYCNLAGQCREAWRLMDGLIPAPEWAKEVLAKPDCDCVDGHSIRCPYWGGV